MHFRFKRSFSSQCYILKNWIASNFHSGVNIWTTMKRHLELLRLRLLLQSDFTSAEPLRKTTSSAAPSLACRSFVSSPRCLLHWFAPACRLPLPLPLPAPGSPASGNSLVTINRSTAGCSHSALLFNSLSALQLWMKTASAT